MEEEWGPLGDLPLHDMLFWFWDVMQYDLGYFLDSESGGDPGRVESLRLRLGTEGETKEEKVLLLR